MVENRDIIYVLQHSFARYLLTLIPKKQIMTRLLLPIACVLLLTACACTADELPMPSEAECTGEIPTYNGQVQAIIETNCAYSGCHLDSAPGNYDSYAGLQSTLEDGSFRERVVSLRTDSNLGMPPDYAPDGRPHDLTEEELAVIECWLSSGYPQ